MNLNTMKQVRHQIWQCFTRSADALFELADALTCEPQARSLPELSLSATFRRKWASVYEALEDGQIDQMLWSEIWTQTLLENHTGPVWVSLDSTSIARPEAETSPDRGIIYVPNMPLASRPVSVGWQFRAAHALARNPQQLGSHSLSEAHSKSPDCGGGSCGATARFDPAASKGSASAG